METPDGYICTKEGDECVIEHKRTGMGCLNLFLGIWLGGWTVGCIFLVHSYLNGGKMEDGSPIPLWFVSAFVIPWFVVALLLSYAMLARKTFRFTNVAMHIETRLFFLRWSVTLPRDTISEIKQMKDGGEGDDSFPSWGLEIRSSSLVDSPWQWFVLLNNFGRNHRMRKILTRLPYDHSKWLGTKLSEWSGVPAKFCPEPSPDE